MTQAPQRRGFNDIVTRFWGVAAPAYNLPFLQQWVYRPAHDEVVAQLRDHQSARIVDVACGTGILADRIERDLHPAAVYGVDMSEGMLNQARSRSSVVQWQRGPAEQLPFDDGALDAVVTTSAFHFFDQPAALREFHRVLSPGGLVAVSTMSARQPLLAGGQQVDTLAQSDVRRDAATVRRRGVHHRRAASGAAAAMDAGYLRPVHGRRQKLTTRGAPAPPRRESTPQHQAAQHL